MASGGPREQRAYAEIFDDGPNLIASGLQAMSERCRLTRRVAQSSQPMKVRRQFQPIDSWVYQQSPMPTELPHEKTEFEEDIVPECGLTNPANFYDVVRLSDGNRKVRFTYGLFQCFKRVPPSKKYSLVPNGGEYGFR